MIKDNIARLRDDISLICRRLGRDPQEIIIVCVTKLATAQMVVQALECGISHIAENRVQEALKKYAALKVSQQKITKHMIGHLQTNKVKDALTIFDMIQSVDSLKLAQTVDRQAGKIKKKTDILVQVNTSFEKQKFGIAFDKTAAFVKSISQFENIRIMGLMTIAPLTNNEETVRSSFRRLRELRDQVHEEFRGANNIVMKYLSMGMTSDYRIALEEGSNMLRIGRAVFTNA